MILSVSTRTDIPAYYGDWFMNWLEQGYFYIKNPYNKNLVTKLDVRVENVDCIVFWTKNGNDFIKHLPRISELNYPFYFQYTITGYDEDIEKLKHSKKEIIANFIAISKMIGSEKMILRYDPILVSDKYTIDYHIKAFERLIALLYPYTNKVVISFLDTYPKIEKKLKTSGLRRPTCEEIAEVAAAFSQIAQAHDLVLATCAEEVDLSAYQIVKNSCVDAELIEKITNKKLNKFVKADKRSECQCLKHIDIGEYETCLADCRYCYAQGHVPKLDNYQADNEFISGKLKDEEVKIKKADEVVFENVEQIAFDFDEDSSL